MESHLISRIGWLGAAAMGVTTGVGELIKRFM
jgi:hypothetical protein